MRAPTRRRWTGAGIAGAHEDPGAADHRRGDATATDAGGRRSAEQRPRANREPDPRSRSPKPRRLDAAGAWACVLIRFGGSDAAARVAHRRRAAPDGDTSDQVDAARSAGTLAPARLAGSGGCRSVRAACGARDPAPGALARREVQRPPQLAGMALTG